MSGPQQQQHGGQWAVLVLNGGIVGLVVVLVAVLALVVNPPSPPGIAAFAPQAAKQIEKAPDAQSAQVGDAPGACAAGQDCAAAPPPSGSPSDSVAASSAPPSSTSAAPTSAAGPAKGVPSSLQCHKWPDGKVTQTFDPQSPPCIASWDEDKGNGGATTKGVDATTIRFAYANTGQAATDAELQPVADFMNTHFQLYGRKIKLVPYTSQQDTQQFTGQNYNDPTYQHADAEAVIQLGVFAAGDFIEPLPSTWSLATYRDTLADAGVVSISGGEVSPYGTTADLAAHAPYEWSFVPTIDTVVGNTAEMTCKQLVGKPASHSTDPATQGKPRKFAMMIPTNAKLGGPLPGLDRLKSTLAGCGANDPEVVQYDLTRASSPALSAKLSQMQRDGVTSLIWFPYNGGASSDNPMKLADNLGYHPEWVTIGWQDYLTSTQAGEPTSETGGMFGVAAWNKLPPMEQELAYQSYVEAGGVVANWTPLSSGRAFYSEMLLLASGIQMAGPNLTPETFAKGLTSTTFPNPGAGKGPTFQAAVGFTPASPVMLDDTVPWWFDVRETASDASSDETGSAGNLYRAHCYADKGRRYAPGSWPTEDRFYEKGVCR